MISHVTGVISLLCLFETGAMGDPSLCTFEINGETKYYVCSRNEQCCKVGCCLSPSFQFYQLWYYWLMVIFMLVVCSGGQWWYKYWVGGGDRSGGAPTVMMRATTSTAGPLPPRPRMGVVASSSAASSSTSASMPTSFTLIHQICKPHHYHSRADGKVPSPYDQIYGPPPSYESVIGSGQVVLPPYSVSPEPLSITVQSNNTGGDPLGVGEQTQIRTQCPSYSQSQLDQQADTDSNADPSAQSSLPLSEIVDEVSPLNRVTAESQNQESIEIGNGESLCDNETVVTTHCSIEPNSTGDSQAQTQQPSSQCLEHQHH